MFTGIIEEIGTVQAVTHHQAPESSPAHPSDRPSEPVSASDPVSDSGTGTRDLRLVVESELIKNPPLGSSIAVDGVCLTVVAAESVVAAEPAVAAGPAVADESLAKAESTGAQETRPTRLAFDVMPQTLQLTTLGKLQPGDKVNLERAALVTARLDGHVVQGHVDGTATLISRQPGPRWDWLRFKLPEHLLPYLAMQGSITVAGVSLTVAALDGNEFCVALIPTTLAHTTLGELTVGQQVNIEVDALAKYADRLLTSKNTTLGGTSDLATGAADDTPWATAVKSGPPVRLSINKIAEAELPTQWGKFQIAIFRDEYGTDHVALTAPPPKAEESDQLPRDYAPDQRPSSYESDQPPLVRVHSECLTGDAFGSLRCDCGPQLHTAMAAVAQQGGAVVYMRGHEGRGIGLAAKIAAYTLQDQGRDTVEANEDLGYPVDARDYAAAATILRALGMSEVRLLTNNPAKQAGLEAAGVKVAELVPLEVGHGPENRTYLETKRARLGHILQYSTANLTGGAQ